MRCSVDETLTVAIGELCFQIQIMGTWPKLVEMFADGKIQIFRHALLNMMRDAIGCIRNKRNSFIEVCIVIDLDEKTKINWSLWSKVLQMDVFRNSLHHISWKLFFVRFLLFFVCLIQKLWSKNTFSWLLMFLFFFSYF